MTPDVFLPKRGQSEEIFANCISPVVQSLVQSAIHISHLNIAEHSI